ncbi:hypothetical protein LWM68_16575 [Niabella sp. W65]|nr:hypothetical protein [Niabella sp. W65]MCH7364227.1 hypothetical protein [Niabella sp. W65]ULT40097.1 hypothetical protein KRR40_35435 [Niabella sp. I65]
MPDIGPRKWVNGRSLGYLGDLQHPGEQTEGYFMLKGRQKSNKFSKNKRIT